MLYYIIPVLVILGILAHGLRAGYERATLVALLAAIGLYYFHFYNTPWDMFTMDAVAHADYVKHIAEYNSLPTREETAAARHPPTYYVAGAMLYKLAEQEQAPEPLLMVRHLSMLCFVVFMLLSITMLRTFLPSRGEGYYCALALLLFWPLGVTMGARITCDILLYAAQAGVLYYLARWFRDKEVGWLRGAFIWAGVSVLAKNTGVIMLGMSCGVLLLALYEHRRNIRLILRRDLILAVVFAFSCWALTASHDWIETVIPVRHRYDIAYWWNSFSSFNLFTLLYETNTGVGQGSFWNVLLHTLLLGDAFPWKSDTVQLCFNIIWFAILVYMVDGTFRFYRILPLHEKKIFQLTGAFLLIFIGALMVMSVRSGNVGYADGRYLYPGVILLSLCYGLITQCHQRLGRGGIHRLGVGLAGCFSLLTAALFFTQYGLN